jgi:hypothetical protein
MARSFTTSSYYTEADNNDWSHSNQDLTIMLWIRAGASGSRYVAGKGGGPWEWAFQRSSSGITIRTWNSSGGTSVSIATAGSLSPDDGDWNCMVAVIDDPETSHRINGGNSKGTSNATDTTFSSSASNTSATMYLGRRGDATSPFAGEAAHFVIWHTNMSLIRTDGLVHGVNPLAYGLSAEMKFWTPLWGYTTQEEDWSRARRAWTANNSPGSVRAGPPVELVEKYIS